MAKLPPNLVLTALLSGSITIIVSVTYTVLCILGLIYNKTCSVGLPETVNGASYLWNVAYRHYIQDGCEQSISLESLTSAHTVFILLIITLIISVLSTIAASFLIAVVRSEDLRRYINYAVYAYVGIIVVSLTIDVVSAIYFGLDYGYLCKQLNMSSGGLGFNYEADILRISAFIFMTISLKGYILHVFNIVLIGIIVFYLNVYQIEINTHQHSIHKVGALNAFDQQRRYEQNWIQPSSTYPPFTRSSSLNNGIFQDDELPQSLPRETRRVNHYPEARAYDRSESWHHSRGVHDLAQGTRPFSYLEEIKLAPALKPTPNPAVEPHWRRDYRSENYGPPVPAPDYSPQGPRRLKSALKSGYL